MYITQCFYSEAGEDRQWHDLNKWDFLKDARRDLKECVRMYPAKNVKGWKWRIILRKEYYRKTEKVIK